MNEGHKYLSIMMPYLGGNGIDIGSGGIAIVPWAIALDLPAREYSIYNNGNAPVNPIHWRGTCRDLPFRDGVCDWVTSNHLIEDFRKDEWPSLISEWARVLKDGGHLLITAPEYNRWKAALANGQPCNCAHKIEPSVGDLTDASKGSGLEVLEDRLTDLSKDDYSLIFIARKAS